MARRGAADGAVRIRPAAFGPGIGPQRHRAEWNAEAPPPGRTAVGRAPGPVAGPTSAGQPQWLQGLIYELWSLSLNQPPHWTHLPAA